MTIVYLTTNRDFYDRKDAAEHSLTVAQLRRVLEDYPSDARIILRNDNGYTYGNIREDHFA